MSTNFFVKRRIGGVAQPPGGANNVGEMAIYFPGVAGDKTKPILYVNDGGGWRTINSAQGTGLHFGADLAPGDAAPTAPKENEAHLFSASGPITDVSWAGTALANERVSRGDLVVYGDNNKWHLISGGKNLQFSTRAEILAGTETSKVIAPDQLRAIALNAPSGVTANDVDRLVRLNANGKIDPRFMSIGGVTFGGALAPGDPAPAAPKEGEIHFFNAGGAVTDASWTGTAAANQTVRSGDMLLYGNSAWHLLSSEIDINNFVFKSGANSIANDMTMVWAAPATANTVIIDGSDATKSSIDNVTLDCGTY